MSQHRENRKDHRRLQRRNSPDSDDWPRIPKAKRDDAGAHRLARCLDLFDFLEPTDSARPALIAACQVEPGALREAALVALTLRVYEERSCS